MSRRGAISLLIGCIFGLGLVWIFQSNRQSKQPSLSPERETVSPDTVRDSAPPSPSPGMQRSPLADELNAPGSTAHRDVRVLREIFMHWQSNLKGVGNPIGTNAEITDALTGNNALKLAFVPPDHPAINETVGKGVVVEVLKRSSRRER